MNKINVNKITLEEKIAQLLMFAFHGQEYNDQIDYLVKNLKIGGLIYFSRNFTNKEISYQLNKKIQAEAKIPLFLSLDQEGGIVQRIIKDMTPFPGAMAVSASQESNYELCYAVGRDLKKMGFNMNFAPVADVNNNPLNPVINSRSYSDDQVVCGEYVINAAKGFQDAQVIPTAKHFPGHGDTSVDSHVSLPKVDKSLDKLEKTEFVPFEMAIKSGIEGIMVSHILYPAIDSKYPATLSKNIITNVLKEKMGFEGLIVTDSLTMGAIYNNYSPNEIVRLACNAGIDLLVFCGKADLEEQKNIFRGFVEEVKKGNIPMERIDESFNKIIKYKEKYILNSSNDSKKDIDGIKIGKDISHKSITLVKDDSLLPIKDKILVIFPKIKVFSLVDNDNQEYDTLGKILNENKIACDEVIYEENEDIIKKIIDNNKKYDKIILATYNVRKNDYQEKLWEGLKTIRAKIIVVSMRSPYDIMYLEGVKTYICIYETSTLAFNSLAKCLLENKFYGKLPVKLGGF